MSGSQIGGVLGGVIGFIYGGPAGAQWGVAIGSTVGSYISPDVIKAPSIGDAARQGSTAGWPIPKIYGHPAPQGVCLIDGDPIARKITVETEQGKGAPATVESEKYIATRCFLVCEGEIAGYARIRRNGKLVYSTIAGDQLDADSSAFVGQLRLYYGSETQLPDPALEAIHGVGNAHAYRGKAYFVVVDDDEGQSGTPNQYQVEPIESGTISSTSGSYDALGYGDIPWNEGAPTLNDPRKSGLGYEYKYVANGLSYDPASTTGWRDSESEAIDDATAAGAGSAIGTPQLVGWSTRFYGASEGVNIAPWEDVDAAGQTEWRDRYVLGLHYTRYTAEIAYSTEIFEGGGSTTGAGSCAYHAEPLFAIRVVGNNGTGTLFSIATVQSFPAPAGHNDTWGCYADEYESSGLGIFTGFTIACRPKLACGFGDVPSDAIQAPDSSHVYVDLDGVIYTKDICTEVTGTFKQLQILSHGLDGGTLGTDIIETKPIGPVVVSGSADDTEAFWEAAYAVAVAAGDMEAGLTYPGSYPVSVTDACQCTPAVPLIDPDAAILKDIVLDIASRVPAFPMDRMDVDNMLDEVPGYRLTRSDLSAIDYMIDVSTPYWYDFADYDDQIHAILRGGAIVETITDDDLLEIEEDDDETRNQQIDYPGRVTFFYPDPANNYVMTPQSVARESPDVLASSAINIQTQIPFTSTEAIQRADIFQKIAFARAEGKLKRALPSYYTRLVPTDPISYQDRRYMIKKTERDDSMITIEAEYDRVNLYSSAMTGESGPAPQGQATNIKGPTILVPLNLPQLRSQDSSPGLYMPACGLLASWPGCDVLMSVDGGASYQNVMRITKGATIGELSEACDADGADSTGLLSVRIYNPGSLQSVTEDQLPARRNGFALETADVAEVGQFQIATETSTPNYWEITNVLRGQLGTDAVSHPRGSRFVLLDPAPPFLSIDLEHSGKVLKFKGVTLGTSADAATVVDILYLAPEYIEDGGEI